MTKVKYRWSTRSKPDVCEYQVYVTKNERLCYHCGMLIPANSQTILLLTERGEHYILHKSCADKSCQMIEGE